MAFSSVPFVFYFLPAALVLYYLFVFSVPIKNIILLICSLAFYAWGEPKYIALLGVSIFFNYCFGLLINLAKKRKTAARILLALGVIFNLGALFLFKYLGFFIKNANALLSSESQIPAFAIALPIGISFFTFQAISYLVDVYRKDVPAQKNLFYFGLYLSFFAKLTQGPVMKYETFAPQIKNRRESWDKFSAGCCLFITGLGKKVLIANNMAVVADRVFEILEMGNLPVSLAWLGALAYTFQIYFDFSGYSDMAIGVGLMFGFKLDKNFNYPYISKSITEFWRRWHMSLGLWFRDYLYIPLGGSHVVNKDKIIRNLAIVWISTGVWHGANWTFLVWGILNFLVIVVERMFQLEESKIPNAVKHTYSMLVIIIGWVIFRADSLHQAGKYIVSMFNFVQNGIWSDYTTLFLKEFGVFFLAAAIFSVPLAGKINQFLAKGLVLRRTINPQPPHDERIIAAEPPFAKLVTFVYPLVMVGLFLTCTTYLVKGSYNPFIYFQF